MPAFTASLSAESKHSPSRQSPRPVAVLSPQSFAVTTYMTCHDKTPMHATPPATNTTRIRVSAPRGQPTSRPAADFATRKKHSSFHPVRSRAYLLTRSALLSDWQIFGSAEVRCPSPSLYCTDTCAVHVESLMTGTASTLQLPR
jgi:hypothetical protein